MNQKFTNVIISAVCAIFWGVITEALIAITGKLDTPHGWIPITVMVAVFGLSLVGLNWLTSETR